MNKLVFTLAVVACAAVASGFVYDDEDIGAYHFHTYFFEDNPRHSKEAMDFRKATRALINDGNLTGCSLNSVEPGIDGPHPFGQYELCCNKTSFPRALAFHMKNHGNLSVLIHPLTRQDIDDHVSRISWIGQAVPLDDECPCLYPELPRPRPCPVYPDYPDEIPRSLGDHLALLQKMPKPIGTEDYRNISQIDLTYASY